MPGHLCGGIFPGQPAPGDGRIRRSRPFVHDERLRAGTELRAGTGGRRCAMTWRLLLLTVSASIASAVNLSAQPLITELQPRGAQKGKPFTLTLAGRNLGEGAKIRSTMPASFTLLAPDQPALVPAPG